MVPDDFPHQRLHVVGDRVLVLPEDGEERTKVGLYLPASAMDTQPVQSGLIVATGPGDPIADPGDHEDEPWKLEHRPAPRFRPIQAKVGDQAIFFRKAAVEVTFEDKRYLVVPLAAVLLLIRDDLPA